jgi:hypothetical protein
MAEAVYLLCAVTSVACATLLWRGYVASRTKLLFWSSLCFAGLALNNVLLVVDLMLVPDQDLSITRNAAALASMLVLLFGLVWESH